MTLTEEGIAVVDGDAWLSQQIRDEHRLDVHHARLIVEMMQRFIPTGGLVADIGACLGDHTITYASFVGPTGTVHAVEPNPAAYECLRHNLRNTPWVQCHPIALADRTSRCVIGPEPNHPDNLGMATIYREAPDGPTVMTTLDVVAAAWPRLDFLKIDVEGVEVAVLVGGEQTIRRWRPPLLIEVNRGALENHGCTPRDLFLRLHAWGYVFMPICFTHGITDPLRRIQDDEVDVVCVPQDHAMAHGFLDLAG